MNSKLSIIKWLIALIYLSLIIIGVTFLIKNYNISDFFSYEFLRLNKDTILNYKNENFLILTIMFFIFSIVWTLLRQYNEGLICMSACLKGEVPEKMLRGDYNGARKTALEFSEIFVDRYYLEIQNHGIPEEEANIQNMKKSSKISDPKMSENALVKSKFANPPLPPAPSKAA